MFEDIFPYDDMKDKMSEQAKNIKNFEPDDYFDELMDIVKELTEEIEQAELDV